jgi:hypothetical protein
MTPNPLSSNTSGGTPISDFFSWILKIVEEVQLLNRPLRPQTNNLKNENNF